MYNVKFLVAKSSRPNVCCLLPNDSIVLASFPGLVETSVKWSGNDTGTACDRCWGRRQSSYMLCTQDLH